MRERCSPQKHDLLVQFELPAQPRTRQMANGADKAWNDLAQTTRQGCNNPGSFRGETAAITIETFDKSRSLPLLRPLRRQKDCLNLRILFVYNNYDSYFFSRS
jgi:hypothetical protein